MGLLREAAWQKRTASCSALRELGLDGRIANALARYGLMPNDVGQMTDAELDSMRNIGPHSVALIRGIIPYGTTTPTKGGKQNGISDEHAVPSPPQRVAPTITSPSLAAAPPPTREPLIVNGEVVD